MSKTLGDLLRETSRVEDDSAQMGSIDGHHEGTVASGSPSGAINGAVDNLDRGGGTNGHPEESGMVGEAPSNEGRQAGQVGWASRSLLMENSTTTPFSSEASGTQVVPAREAIFQQGSVTCLPPLQGAVIFEEGHSSTGGSSVTGTKT